MAEKAQLLEDSLLVIWNDRDADRRLQSMQSVYSPDIHFYESSDGEALVGFDAINDQIEKLQKEWPVEFQFQLNKPSLVNHSVQMISWDLGPVGAAPVATGMDIAIIKDNLISSLHLFLNAPDQ